MWLARDAHCERATNLCLSLLEENISSSLLLLENNFTYSVGRRDPASQGDTLGGLAQIFILMIKDSTLVTAPVPPMVKLSYNTCHSSLHMLQLG